MIGPYYVNNEARRRAAWGPPCSIPFGTVTIYGRQLKCHKSVVRAFQEWERIRAKHGYEMPGTDTGFYNCRRMRHNPNLPWSAHAWATAMDGNWLQNPAGRKLVTDMPPAMIKELQSLKTVSGAYVFMWGGDWDRDPRTNHTYLDAMHWEVVAHPLDLASGFMDSGAPLISVKDGDEVTLNRGDRGNVVRALQKELNAWSPALRLTVDGIFGQVTESAVKQYQQAADLPVSGVVDSLTAAFLLTTRSRNS